VIKRILQFKKLLDELETISVKKLEQPVEPVKHSPGVKFSAKSIAKANKTEHLLAEEDKNDSVDEEISEETGEKRAITYQMSKNKGLTPHRKKEQKNPRVKHRNKFRKANIRRKGMVSVIIMTVNLHFWVQFLYFACLRNF